MKVAVIDIGSNTIRLAIYLRTANGFKRIFSEKEMVGLVGYITDRTMSADGIELLITILEGFQQRAQIIQVDTIQCLATASLRGLENTAVIIKEVKDRLELSIQVLSGEEEAFLGFLGSQDLLDDQPGIMVDLGGGSTELVSIENRKICNSTSLPFGVLLLHNRFVRYILPTAEENQKIQEYLRQQLAQLPWLQSGKLTLYANGGTGRAIGDLHQYCHHRRHGEALHGYRLPAGELEEIIAWLQTYDEAAIKALIKVVPERLHLIFPGLLVFATIMKVAKVDEICVSRNGLREGFMRQWVNSLSGH